MNQFYACIVPFQLLFNTVEYVVDVQFKLLSQRYERLSVQAISFHVFFAVMAGFLRPVFSFVRHLIQLLVMPHNNF